MRESWGGKKERYRARHAEGVTEKWRERERERGLGVVLKCLHVNESHLLSWVG